MIETHGNHENNATSLNNVLCSDKHQYDQQYDQQYEHQKEIEIIDDQDEQDEQLYEHQPQTNDGSEGMTDL